jgi:hypothetical protein
MGSKKINRLCTINPEELINVGKLLNTSGIILWVKNNNKEIIEEKTITLIIVFRNLSRLKSVEKEKAK